VGGWCSDAVRMQHDWQPDTACVHGEEKAGARRAWPQNAYLSVGMQWRSSLLEQWMIARHQHNMCGVHVDRSCAHTLK